MTKPSTAKLIHTWKAEDKHTYRLIAKGQYTYGYEDSYVVEKLETDELGGNRWTVAREYERDSSVRPLIDALKQLAPPVTSNG